MQKQVYAPKTGAARRSLLAGIAIICAPHIVQAQEKFQFGDVNVTVNGALTIGTSIRTSAPDPALLTRPNGNQVGVAGPTAVKGQNQDDGDLNYKRGKPVASPIQGDLSVDARYRDFGLFLSGKAWYDWTLNSQGVPHGNEANGYVPGIALSDRGFAPEARFTGAALMDAYIYGKFKLGGIGISGRAGNQVINWGQNAMIAGGMLTSINGIDFNTVYRPGAQPNEMLNREPAIYGKIDLTDKVALDAFYRFLPSLNTPVGCGTFFSQVDYIQTGCNYILAGGPGTDAQQIAAGYVFNRAATPKFHDPQFGFGGSFKADALHTLFAIHYAHVDDTLVVPGAVTTSRSLAVPFVPGSPAKNPLYFTANPPGMSVIGLDFKTHMNGTTVYGEATIKPQAPLAYNGSDVIAAFASSVAPTLLRSTATALGATGRSFNGYDRFDQAQFNLGAKQLVPNVLGARVLVLNGEVALKQVYGLPNVNVARFGRSDVYGSGPVGGVCPPAAPGETAAMRALQCSNNGYVTSNAWGYRLNAALNYTNVFKPGLNFTPSIGITHDVSGWSGDTLFNQGRVILNLALHMQYQKRFFAGAAWNPELVKAKYDQNSDRQVVSIFAGIKF